MRRSNIGKWYLIQLAYSLYLLALFGYRSLGIESNTTELNNIESVSLCEKDVTLGLLYVIIRKYIQTKNIIQTKPK